MATPISKLPFLSTQRDILENPEASLIARCQAGDHEAFGMLMARHQDGIYNLCLWHLRDAEAASDATQDAFIRAFRALKNFRGDCAFATWLHHIAVNIAKDAAVRRNRAPISLSTFENDEQIAPEPAAPASYQPCESVIRQERRRAVRKALSSLPDHHRLVLVLFDIQGYSYAEIAQLLELPLGTVRSRLNRARAALRDRLEPHQELFEN